MKRRQFITLLGGAAAASAISLPRPALAQQSAMPLIGFLSAVSTDGFAERMRGFRQGLKDAGFTEGENVAIEYRWADNRLDRLPALAADLVRKRVSVIVATGGTAPAIAAKAATSTIPIVFTVPEDPVELGLVASLSRPGGNLSGLNLFVGELLQKRLEVLRDVVPAMTKLAVLVNPANPARAEKQQREAESAAQAMGLHTRTLRAGSTREINEAFAAMARERPDALLIAPDPFYSARRVQLATLAARHALPASSSIREFVEAGGLMSYGTDIVDAYRQTGIYAGRVLKGAKPADLPVMQSSRFELVINAQTAEMLGLTIPPTVLSVADEVIE